MAEIERLESRLAFCAAERCRLGKAQGWPGDPAISAEIEAIAKLDHQTRERLAQLQQRKGH
jgi:hypothetical protein